MDKIFSVVVNYQRSKDTSECLQSLETAGFKQERIVLIDNNSGDDSAKILAKKFPCLNLIKSQKNLGFAQGNNEGIKLALKKGATQVLFLNNDAYVEKNFLKNISQALHLENKAAIIGPKIYFAPGYEYHKKYSPKDSGKVIWYAGASIDWQNVLGKHRGLDEVDRGQYDSCQKTEFVSGCCMLIKKEVFSKIGFFDPRYFLYLEDMDFCVRAKKAGFGLYYFPQAVVWHKNLGTGKNTSSALQDYYYTRNRLLFGFHYCSWRTKFALLREALKFLGKGNQEQKKAVVDFFRQKFGEK